MVVFAAIIKCRQNCLPTPLFSFTYNICLIMSTKLTLYMDTVLFTVLPLCVDVHVLVVSLCTDTMFVACSIVMCRFIF